MQLSAFLPFSSLTRKISVQAVAAEYLVHLILCYHVQVVSDDNVLPNAKSIICVGGPPVGNYLKCSWCTTNF